MNIKNRLKKLIENEKLNITIGKFYDIEYLLYLLSEGVKGLKKEEVSYWLMQYYKEFDTSMRVKDNRYLYAARKGVHKYFRKMRFREDFDQYMKLPFSVRLYSEEQDGSIVVNDKIKIEVERAKGYERDFQDGMLKKESKVEYLSGTGHYKRSIRSSDERFNIEKTMISLEGGQNHDNSYKLQEYMKKKKTSLDLNLNLNEYVEELEPRWEERPHIEIKSYLTGDKELEYNGFNHIVGLLGAGKSTYINLETIRLIKDRKVKIGIIKSNVGEVSETVDLLNSCGIKAVPLIGKSSFEKHRENYVVSRLKKGEGIGNIFNSPMGEYLGGICSLASEYGNDDMISSEFPCDKLVDKNDQNKCCIKFKECGYFKRFRDLREADVYITTSQALLKSKINKMIDPYERTYYEFLFDSTDIIFVDEGDAIQSNFDDNFIGDDLLASGKDSILNKLKMVNEKISQLWGMNFDEEIHRFKGNIPKLDTVFHVLERLINEIGKEKKNYKGLFNQNISLVGLKKDIYKMIEEEEGFKDELDKFTDLLKKGHQSNELYENDFYKLYSKLHEGHNLQNPLEEIDSLLSESLKKYKVEIRERKGRSPKRLFKQKVELLIYLSFVDNYFKAQKKTLLNLMKAKPELRRYFLMFDLYESEFEKDVYEPLLGETYGYNIHSQGNNFQIKLISYNGIGRSLLENWSNLKKEKGLEGPGVIVLSGTSFAPGSAHYNLKTRPKYYLKSEIPEGRIEQKILTKYREGDIEGRYPLRISGSSNKDIELAVLTRQLLDDIEYELQESNYKRRVMLVVNSYDQCRLVGEVLANSNRFDFKILSNSEEISENQIRREEIENIPNMENPPQVLVAPLSIISRGYNIIDKKEDTSYFGSMFFLIRPYLIPRDMSYYFKVINHLTLEYLDEEAAKGSNYIEAIERVRSRVYGFHSMEKEEKIWKNLSPEERKILSWFTLISIKQAIGRMQRSGASCKVFYCDYSFISTEEELTKEVSMLKAWEDILQDAGDEDLGQWLYGELLEGLSIAIDEYEEENREHEEEW